MSKIFTGFLISYFLFVAYHIIPTILEVIWIGFFLILKLSG